jgi:hypothetical protein
MTRAEELLALAARVEALSGPDRDLDAEIAVAVSGDAGAWVVRPSPQSVFAHLPGWYRTSDDKSHQAPAYTASLDAAMTLVPEGWAVDRLSMWPASPDEASNKGGPQSTAMLVGTSINRRGGSMFWGHGGKDGRAEATAATPALALMAANLRALAALETGATA